MQKNPYYVFSEPIQFRVTSRIRIDVIIRRASYWRESRQKRVSRDLTKRHDSTKKARLKIEYSIARFSRKFDSLVPRRSIVFIEIRGN